MILLDLSILCLPMLTKVNLSHNAIAEIIHHHKVNMGKGLEGGTRVASIIGGIGVASVVREGLASIVEEGLE